MSKYAHTRFLSKALAAPALALAMLALPAAVTAHGKDASDAGDQAPAAVMPGTHKHGRWPAPPPEYADKIGSSWRNEDAAKRGAKIFARQCAMCHGADGRGTGPVATNLAHAPANLNHHFHKPTQSGDAYLFWRISEGGMVEPFKSQDSAMPAFKHVLSEEQRWDVLSYVHQLFHRGAVGGRKVEPEHPMQGGDR